MPSQCAPENTGLKVENHMKQLGIPERFAQGVTPDSQG
jgi:hypothetical protein